MEVQRQNDVVVRRRILRQAHRNHSPWKRNAQRYRDKAHSCTNGYAVPPEPTLLHFKARRRPRAKMSFYYVRKRHFICSLRDREGIRVPFPASAGFLTIARVRSWWEKKIYSRDSPVSFAYQKWIKFVFFFLARNAISLITFQVICNKFTFDFTCLSHKWMISSALGRSGKHHSKCLSPIVYRTDYPLELSKYASVLSVSWTFNNTWFFFCIIIQRLCILC